MALLVEGEGGGRAVLLVDAIHGQRQVVIKSLEANYRAVPGIAAATVMGDGRVALILDVDAVVTTIATTRTRARTWPGMNLLYWKRAELWRTLAIDAMSDASTKHGAELRELIAFRVGRQEFCVDIMMVREIRGWTAATALPRAPRYVRGVINLRGAVLPIVDLAVRLGLPSTEPTARNVIIVVQIGAAAGRPAGRCGLRYSHDQRRTASSRRRTSPPTGAQAFVRGLLSVDGRMISLISLDQVLPAPSWRRHEHNPLPPGAAKPGAALVEMRRVRLHPARFRTRSRRS